MTLLSERLLLLIDHFVDSTCPEVREKNVAESVVVDASLSRDLTQRELEDSRLVKRRNQRSILSTESSGQARSAYK